MAGHQRARADRSLVVICTAAHLPPATAWRERAAAVRAAGSPEVVADVVLGRWFTGPYAAAHPDGLARHRAMIAGTASEGYAGCCEAIADLDVRAGLPGIAAPTLVIAAGRTRRSRRARTRDRPGGPRRAL